ncbi:hypothetical protein KCU92_g6740, partial [Aureobasidium melanogenum]
MSGGSGPGRGNGRGRGGRGGRGGGGGGVPFFAGHCLRCGAWGHMVRHCRVPPPAGREGLNRRDFRESRGNSLQLVTRDPSPRRRASPRPTWVESRSASRSSMSRISASRGEHSRSRSPRRSPSRGRSGYRSRSPSRTLADVHQENRENELARLRAAAERREETRRALKEQEDADLRRMEELKEKNE